MSTFKNFQKSQAREHRERHQPASRSKLGLLEKKQDYKIRAEVHHKKERRLKRLHQLAADKNPDEFYYRMTSTKLKDGIHEVVKENFRNPKNKEEEALLKTRDVQYVTMKRTIEARMSRYESAEFIKYLMDIFFVSSYHKKVEKLKGSHHLIGAIDLNPVNNHTIFVDSDEDVENFDVPAYFNTHPALINNPSNRLTVDQLQTQNISQPPAKSRENAGYRELLKRIEREKMLKVSMQKLQQKKNLCGKNKVVRKIKAETKHSPAIYKWKMIRQK